MKNMQKFIQSAENCSKCKKNNLQVIKKCGKLRKMNKIIFKLHKIDSKC